MGYGQNVPMPKRTQFWSKRTHFFGQNVPSPPKRTQPFGQNVPNIFFPDIQYIFLLFCQKKLFAHWSKRTQQLFQSKLLIYSSIISC